jgi:hypothetical protein
MKLMFDTLVEMEHFIQTPFGDSARHFRATSTPFHGIGQGNGASPMIWVMVSSPLLQQLHHHNCGISTPSSISNDVIDLAAFNFVDNNDMLEEGTSMDDLLLRAQKSLDVWTTGILRA